MSRVDNSTSDNGSTLINSAPRTKLSGKESDAISLFENAIEKESTGLMSEAVDLYRRAFKLNENVDKLYRSQRLPSAIKRLKEEHGKNSVQKVDEEKVKSIDVESLIDSFSGTSALSPQNIIADETQDDLEAKISSLKVSGAPKDISPLLNLPLEIWSNILSYLVLNDPEAWISFALTCKRNAYVGLGTSSIWRKLCLLIYPRQVYFENLAHLQNRALESVPQEDDELPVPINQLLILPQYNNSWRLMLRTRPFVKFNGVYISVVNYYSEGGRKELSSSYSNPVRLITYYRYLRFYPDGTCLMLLSSLDPKRMIPYFLRLNMKKRAFATEPRELGTHQNSHQSLTGSGQNEHKIYHGNWSITVQGEVNIEIKEGSVPYYDFFCQFQIKSSGTIFKFNTLRWIRYYAIRKSNPNLAYDDDERIGEEVDFNLQKEKLFKFSRVKSFNSEN